MGASWVERIRHWLHAEPASSTAFDPIRFEKLCLEDPKAAQAALAADQRELAAELERTYKAYEERLQTVAARLSTLSPENLQREARTLREVQDGLRRTLRRIDASSRSARELERELQEWQQRESESGPPHADHPQVRAEIIRSELAARKGVVTLATVAPERSPFRLREPVVFSPEEQIQAVEEPLTEEAQTEMLPDIDPQHLVGLIRQETREAERWHAIPMPDYEAIEQVRQVKALHVILKRLDRERGVQRDRLSLAVQMREPDRL